MRVSGSRVKGQTMQHPDKTKVNMDSPESARAANSVRPVSGSREDTFDLQKLLHYLIAKAIPIFLAAVIMAVGAGIYARMNTSPISYVATAKLYTVGSSTISEMQMSTLMSADYLELFNTWELHESVRQETGLELSDAALRSMLTITAPEASHILYITVNAPNPETAIELANAYSRAVQVMTVQKMNADMPSVFSKAVSARLMGGGSNMVTMALCGFLLGLILACGVVGLMAFLDDKPHIPEDIDLGTHGGIVSLLAKTRAKKIAMRDRNFPDGEGLHIYAFPAADQCFQSGIDQLCAKLACNHSAGTVCMITSRYTGEGKSVVAMNVLKQLSTMKKKVVLVDVNMRTTCLRDQFGLVYAGESMLDMIDYLTGRCSVSQVLYPTSMPNGYIVPSKVINDGQISLLSSSRMGELLDTLKQSFDVILLDVPAAGMYPDATVLAGYCEEALLVVEYDRGSSNDIPMTAQKILSSGCRNISAVINRIPFRSYLARRYYYKSECYTIYRTRQNRWKKRYPV